MATKLPGKFNIPQKVIRELKYAHQLHLRELAYRIKEQKDVIQEKDFVIKILLSKKATPPELRKTKQIVKKWGQNHLFWLDLIKKDAKWAKEGGSPSWHKRWIKVYQDILDYLSSQN